MFQIVHQQPAKIKILITIVIRLACRVSVCPDRLSAASTPCFLVHIPSKNLQNLCVIDIAPKRRSTIQWIIKRLRIGIVRVAVNEQLQQSSG